MRYFLYDRKLLSDLSRCGWEALKAFYTNGVRDSKAVPGAVIAIQTFGLRLEPTARRETLARYIIMDFIAMLRVENEKRQTPTIKSPASLNLSRASRSNDRN
jgi:hypothetical protein